MNALYGLKEMLMKELEDYGKQGKLTTGTLDVVDKLAHATKNLCKVIEYCEKEEYSRAVDTRDMSNRGSYAMSNARGRGRGARRDSMGRYASSYGYSGHDEMRMELEDIRNMATDQQTKEMVDRIIEKMDQM